MISALPKMPGTTVLETDTRNCLGVDVLRHSQHLHLKGEFDQRSYKPVACL